MIMKQNTILIKDLSIGYPGKSDVKIVADHINAGINSGELTCLLGANGVGKSTLLRTLSAFQPKLGGEIFGHAALYRSHRRTGTRYRWA